VRDLLATDLGVPVSGWLDDRPDLSFDVIKFAAELYQSFGGALLRRTDVLVRLAPYEIVDFVLAPLAYLQSQKAYETQARLLFAKLCFAVAQNSRHAPNAAAWLVLSDSISKGLSLEDGRMAMWAALDDIYEMTQHLDSVLRDGAPEQSAAVKQRRRELQEEGLERCRLALASLTSVAGR
jgi:hypothetical protein